MTPRLTKRSKTVRLLRAKFENGAITGKEDPKTVWEADDVFRWCDLTKFRTCYNNMRKEFSNATGKDEATLNRKATVPDKNNALKRRWMSGADDMEDRVEDYEGEGNEQSGLELNVDANFYKPIYMISRWTEPGVMTRILTITVWLRSRAGGFFISCG